MNAYKTDLSIIIKKMAENLDGLRWGCTAVQLRVHDGRVVDISYTVTHSTRENAVSIKNGESNEKR